MYDKNNIQNKIIKIVNTYMENVEISLEQADEDLSQLGMNSIIFIASLIAIEDAFSVEIPYEYLAFSKMNSISKMTKVIERLLYD